MVRQIVAVNALPADGHSACLWVVEPGRPRFIKPFNGTVSINLAGCVSSRVRIVDEQVSPSLSSRTLCAYTGSHPVPALIVLKSSLHILVARQPEDMPILGLEPGRLDK